jgi:FkbM family methyltransferase
MHAVIRRNPSLMRLALAGIPDIRVSTNISGIGKFRIRLKQHRSFWLRDPLTHERIMLGGLQRLTPRGSVAYDIGANIGLYSRFLLNYFGAGSLVAFEPMFENAEILRSNLAEEPSVRIIEAAIADFNGIDELQLDDVMSASAVLNVITQGKASVGRRNCGLPPLTRRVEVFALDSAIKTFQLRKPDVLKVDVEGAEARVLNGAAALLREVKPRIAMELHGPACARDAVRLLTRAGYHVYGYMRQGNEFRYSRVSPADTGSLLYTGDLHHIFASPDSTDLDCPIEPLTIENHFAQKYANPRP